MAHPVKNHSKISKTALWPQIFLRLRRAKRGFALGRVLHSPESATRTVPIIPVGAGAGVDIPGEQFAGAVASGRSSLPEQFVLLRGNEQTDVLPTELGRDFWMTSGRDGDGGAVQKYRW